MPRGFLQFTTTGNNGGTWSIPTAAREERFSWNAQEALIQPYAGGAYNNWGNATAPLGAGQADIRFALTGDIETRKTTMIRAVRLRQGRLWRAEIAGAAIDSFDRDDSTLTLGSADTGQSWTAVQGTWGIDTNEAYSVTTTDEDLVTIPAVADGEFKVTMRGALTGASYSVPKLIFRYNSSNEYLAVQCISGNVELWKNDSGWTQLATATHAVDDNTDFTLRVVCSGNNIDIEVDGTHRISYTLSGSDTKYASYTTAGLSLGRNGSPASEARFSSFSAVANPRWADAYHLRNPIYERRYGMHNYLPVATSWRLLSPFYRVISASDVPSSGSAVTLPSSLLGSSGYGLQEYIAGEWSITSSPYTFTVVNTGDVPTDRLLIRFVSQSTNGFTSPSLTNATTGLSFSSTTNGTAANDILSVRCWHKRVVEISRNGGTSWTDDYAQFSLGANQSQFMELAYGSNSFTYTDGGTPNLLLQILWYPAYLD